jgi:hypothetical protein
VADKEGCNAWVQSSPEGYSLYVKQGFEPVDTQDLEIVERFGAKRSPGITWGENAAVEKLGPLAPGHFRTVMMRRTPRSRIDQPV